MGESEKEAKKRKGEARLLSQKLRNEEGREKFLALPEDHADKRKPHMDEWFSILQSVKSHPRSKSLTILCDSSWNPDPSAGIVVSPLGYLYFRYVVGDPKLPELATWRNLMNDFGFLWDSVYQGKAFLSQDQELREKLEAKGALTGKPRLLCPCGREVRFSSSEDFLECVKVILTLRLEEASLSLFQMIKDKKGKTRS